MSDREPWFLPIHQRIRVTQANITEAINSLVNDANGIFFQAAPGFIGNYPVGALPTNFPPGSWAFAEDGCKIGEPFGMVAGTGIPVYFTGLSWRTFSSDQPPQV